MTVSFRHSLPAFQRISAWVALLVVLLQALLPVLSHAMVSRTAQTQGWVEVCTISGMAWVRIADAPASATELTDAQDTSVPPASSVLTHGCEWCATHPPLTALPLVSLSVPIVLSDWATHPPAFFHAPRLLAVWASAHSRAPPVLV